MSEYISKWHRELGIFAGIKPLILLEGNVLDSYQYPVEGSTPKGSILRLSEYLYYFLKDMGYRNVVFYDSLQGFYNHCEENSLRDFATLVNATPERGSLHAEFKSGLPAGAPAMVRRALSQGEQATAVVMDFASRYITTPDNPDQCEVDGFTVLLQASLDAKDVKTEQGLLKNLLLLIVNKANDIPAWFYLQNPNVKIVTLSAPNKEEREALVKSANFASFFAADVYREDAAYYEERPDELEKLQDKFVALTEGFSFTEINSLRRLCKNGRYRIGELSDVVDLYKYGIRENPWKSLDLDTIRKAEKTFERRVKGQRAAVTKTLDVVKRAITGMAQIQGGSQTRPKGVLFFAGPTGTGKTETAKTLAEILFGDENCCVRFDMSEYSLSHSDQKLLGAPPGYVGYEAGGQLTNAVKKNPFTILLFDEIEKAHPSVMDKFLQILEDGRMTDGQGNTVYFSETVIIFTSNLGVYSAEGQGRKIANVNPAMDYPRVADIIRRGIEDYFKLELGRPEILNRIGENIVVFDYIRPDVAAEILDSQLSGVISRTAETLRIDLTVSAEARQTLLEAVLGKLENGGRGVRNVLEDLLIFPLSRFLFDNGVFENAAVTVERIDTDSSPAAVECTVNT